MDSINFTLEVSKFDKSIDSKEEQPSNIEAISVTDNVSKLF